MKLANCRATRNQSKLVKRCQPSGDKVWQQEIATRKILLRYSCLWCSYRPQAKLCTVTEASEKRRVPLTEDVMPSWLTGIADRHLHEDMPLRCTSSRFDKCLEEGLRPRCDNTRHCRASGSLSPSSSSNCSWERATCRDCPAETTVSVKDSLCPQSPNNSRMMWALCHRPSSCVRSQQPSTEKVSFATAPAYMPYDQYRHLRTLAMSAGPLRLAVRKHVYS